MLPFVMHKLSYYVHDLEFHNQWLCPLPPSSPISALMHFQSKKLIGKVTRGGYFGMGYVFKNWRNATPSVFSQSVIFKVQVQ